MSTAIAYAPPSREELANEIRQFAPAMFLYHRCPEWLRMEIFARDFYLPPDIEGHPLIEHPVDRLRNPLTGEDAGPRMVKANGQLAVRDIYGILRDIRNSNRPRGIGLLQGQDSGAIVMYAIDTYGERGVVWLRGDDTDEQRKTASAKLYSRFIRSWAEEQRSARAEAVRRWNDNPENKGRVPPPPTGVQIRAQEILDQIAVETRKGAEYICQVCYGWEGDSFEKFQRHMKASHGRHVERPRDETVSTLKGGGRSLSQSELGTLENPPDEDGVAPTSIGAAAAAGLGQSLGESPLAERNARRGGPRKRK